MFDTIIMASAENRVVALIHRRSASEKSWKPLSATLKNCKKKVNSGQISSF